jgi:hypothetical protein
MGRQVPLPKTPPRRLIFSRPDNHEQNIRVNGDGSLMCGKSGRFYLSAVHEFRALLAA